MPSPENHSTPKTVSVKLDADTRSRIETLAQARQRSAHWLMKKAISQYVDQEEKKEAFKKDTLEAWETFQADGMHVTSSEAEAWLLSWGTDDEKPAPQCHK